MNAKQREAVALREEFMRLAGRTFRMGYDALWKNQSEVWARAWNLYKDCRAAADKCAKLEALASRLR